MKLILKVLLAIGWSLNLFASEGNQVELARAFINNNLTSHSTAILNNSNTTQNEKAEIARTIIAGTAELSELDKSLLGSSLQRLTASLLFYGVEIDSVYMYQVRKNMKDLCGLINSAIERIFVVVPPRPSFLNYNFLDQIGEKDLEFIYGVIYMYCRERSPVAFARLENFNFQKLVEAYKD